MEVFFLTEETLNIIKLKNKFSLIVAASKSIPFIPSPLERLPHLLGLILHKWRLPQCHHPFFSIRKLGSSEFLLRLHLQDGQWRWPLRLHLSFLRGLSSFRDLHPPGSLRSPEASQQRLH